MRPNVKIGVILSGCGVRDDSELHEAVLSLLFLRRAGAALNLSTFSQQGADCQVDSSLAHLLRMLHAQGKPIGAICIAPVILAKLFGSEHPVLTVGNDPQTAQALEAMGAVHRPAKVQEVVVDCRRKFITTPAYMLAKDITEAAAGIERLVTRVVRLAETSRRPSSTSRHSYRRRACVRG